MNGLIVAAAVIWGVPIACLATAAGVAALSPRARDYLRALLISE